MECVCGYTHYNEYQLEDLKRDNVPFNQGDQKFFKMISRQVFDNEQDSYSYYETKREHYIYACPKCGTLKIEL